MKIRTPLASLAVGLLAAVTLASPASAHVSVNPSEAEKGGYAKLSFRVPNEKPEATTQTVEIDFPLDQPLASVRVQPTAGWTYTIEKAAPTTPLSSNGASVSEVTSKVIWTADAGAALKASEFQEFNVSVGALPSDADTMVFKALQTYSNGEVVRWIEETPASGAEPEHPAPTLTLVDATSTTDSHGATTATDASEAAAPAGSESESETTTSNVASTDDVDNARSLSMAGLVAGVLGLLMGGASLLMRRRKN